MASLEYRLVHIRPRCPMYTHQSPCQKPWVLNLINPYPKALRTHKFKAFGPNDLLFCWLLGLF